MDQDVVGYLVYRPLDSSEVAALDPGEGGEQRVDHPIDYSLLLSRRTEAGGWNVSVALKFGFLVSLGVNVKRPVSIYEQTGKSQVSGQDQLCLHVLTSPLHR